MSSHRGLGIYVRSCRWVHVTILWFVPTREPPQLEAGNQYRSLPRDSLAHSRPAVPIADLGLPCASERVTAPITPAREAPRGYPADRARAASPIACRFEKPRIRVVSELARTADERKRPRGARVNDSTSIRIPEHSICGSGILSLNPRFPGVRLEAGSSVPLAAADRPT